MRHGDLVWDRADTAISASSLASGVVNINNVDVRCRRGQTGPAPPSRGRLSGERPTADEVDITRTINVLCTYPLDGTQRGRIEAAAPGLRVTHRRVDDQDRFDELVDDRLEVLLSDRAPSDLTAVGSLRWIQYSGAGVDPPLTARAPWDRGIVVTTANGANALPIGEYVLAAILRVAQQAERRSEHQRQHRWRWDEERKRLLGRSLRGATLVLVGYGSIGREVARLASAFGMRIIAVKSRPEVRRHGRWCVPGTGDPEGELPTAIVGTDELEHAVAQADYIVASVPSTDETRELFGARILRAAPSTAWLVNVGRGDLFDEHELVAALRARELAGATLDVTAVEPLPADSPLWDLSNVIITPHVAGSTADTWEALTHLFVENLRRYAAGEPLLNVYRPELQY